MPSAFAGEGSTIRFVLWGDAAGPSRGRPEKCTVMCSSAEAQPTLPFQIVTHKVLLLSWGRRH
jgi:hypothetical protein